jgi:hypothetical protein
MKPADLLTLHKLEEIQKTLIIHDARVGDQLDRIEDTLKLILQNEPKYVSKELEAIVKEVAVRAAVIDEKVLDTPPEH